LTVPLPVNVEQHIHPRFSDSITGASRRAVAMIKHGGMFKQLPTLDHRLKRRIIDEIIILALNLSGTLATRRSPTPTY